MMRTCELTTTLAITATVLALGVGPAAADQGKEQRITIVNGVVASGAASDRDIACIRSVAAH